MLDLLDTFITFALVMLLLSLLIMTVVESANVLLQRRGRHLWWGVQEILKQMDVDRTSAWAIAERVLRHPALSKTQKVYASAIRPDELARLLHKVLPDFRGNANNPPPDWWTKLMQATTAAAADTLERTIAQRAFAGQAPLAPVHAVAAQLADPLLNALNQANLAAANVTAEQVGAVLSATLAPAIADARQTLADLKAWFNMIMDRTTERFVAWTRWITAGLAFTLCVVCQVDALEILHQLYSDKQLRATMLAQVDPALEKAKGIVALSTGANPLGTVAIKGLEDKLKSNPKTAGAAPLLAKVPGDLDTREKGETWLKQSVADPKEQAALVKQYNEQFQSLTDRRFDELTESRNQLLEQLEKSQLRLFRAPLDYSRYKGWRPLGRHFGGMIMAALLLSLGAPFWFNTLQNLANLRPLIARNVESETKKQAAAT